MENISTLENSSSILSVTLRENNFTKDGTYYATVTRNTATFKNILSEIAEDNKGMDPYMLQFAAILIQKKILKMLEQGKAVNVLDLGTMYIAMKCSAKGKSDVSEKGNFYIKFAPTELANSALSSLSVDKVVYADGKESGDESEWVKVDGQALFRNKPTELNFFVPETLAAGNYRLRLRTAYLGKDKSRKSVVEAFSGVVSVSA